MARTKSSRGTVATDVESVSMSALFERRHHLEAPH
jgi:hypothetical protein